jgi:hypothetical protein
MVVLDYKQVWLALALMRCLARPLVWLQMKLANWQGKKQYELGCSKACLKKLLTS